MNKKTKSLGKVFNRYPSEDYPLLRRDFSNPSLDLRGIKVINNTPLTFETLIKCACLSAAGAELVISFDKDLPFDSRSLDFLERENIDYVEKEKLKGAICDIVLDCNGGLANLVDPSLGFVELTGSGKYQYTDVKSPVVNVDDSCTKTLETFFGTGESLVRALKELGPSSSEELKNKTAIVFGFGKVGKGVAFGLLSEGCKVIIVEKNKKSLEEAKQIKGCFKVISSSEIKKIKDELKSCFIAVTVTGLHQWVSKFYTRDDFSQVKFLANMGAVDEFGPEFKDSDIMNNKFPVNFALSEPTIPMFLDPIFLAHNKSSELLMEKKIPKGFNFLPQNFDLKILKQWSSLYPDFDLTPAFGKKMKLLKVLLSESQEENKSFALKAVSNS